MIKVHYFGSTGEAYDACQCNEEIKNGDVLVIESEKVVGIADAWPVAITPNKGNFHSPREGLTVADYLADNNMAKGLPLAYELAKLLGS